MGKKRTTQRERTAYHEAGHAVVAYRRKRQTKRVPIIPKGDSLGHTSFPLLRNFCPDGEAAETSEFSEDPKDCARRADRQRKKHRREEKRIETEVLIDLAGLVAEETFVGRRFWNQAHSDIREAVDLASYLYPDNEVLQRYIEFMLARVKATIQTRVTWAMIEAVADKLLVQDQLNHSEFRKVVQTVAAGPRGA